MQAERGINRANFSATAVGKKFARGALRQSIFTKWQGRSQATICLAQTGAEVTPCLAKTSAM